MDSTSPDRVDNIKKSHDDIVYHATEVTSYGADNRAAVIAIATE